MDWETNLFPSSPTNSSASSSDLDTASTASFFFERSTTLGTLMGLTFPEAPARPDRGGSSDSAGGRKRRRRGGRRWWRLCRGEVGPTSLEEFLRAERRIGGGGGRLFANGRVLPPTAAAAATRMGRLPELIAGICSGG